MTKLTQYGAGIQLLHESEKVLAWFKRMRDDHDEKLGKSYEEAMKKLVRIGTVYSKSL